MIAPWPLRELRDELLESGLLVRHILQLRDGPQRPLGDRWAADHVGEGQDLLLDLGRKAEETHALPEAPPPGDERKPVEELPLIAPPEIVPPQDLPPQ